MDYYDENERRTHGVLKKFDITLAEHYLLGTVGYDIFLPPEDLAKHTMALVEGDSRGNFSHCQYLQSLDSCIAKGWLQVATPQSCEVEANRRRLSHVPELLHSQPQVGEIEFTPDGYSTFRQTILGIFGQGHIDYDDSGWNLSEEQREFEILAPNERWLQKRVEELVENTSSYVGQDVVGVNVGEPEAVGLWKPNPFSTLPEGFRSKVVYRFT